MTLTEFLLARVAEDEAVALIDAAEMERSSITIQFDCETQARFTPARVLAECEAKRLTVNAHSSRKDDAVRSTLRVVLEILALPYAEHPDYDPAWAV